MTNNQPCSDTSCADVFSSITNDEFIKAVFPALPEHAFAAVCSKSGDLSEGGWPAQRADQAATNLAPKANNYVNCSSFYYGDNGLFRALKGKFAACHFLMLDDLGTKVDLDRFEKFDLSWLIETSPSNYQAGIILAKPIIEGDEAERLLNALIDAKLCDAGANQPLTRWARLPMAINGKPKHQTESGAPFQCSLTNWRPDCRYSTEAIVEGLQLELAPIGRPKKTKVSGRSLIIRSADEGVHTPAPTENPIVLALKDHGLYKTPLGEGKHDITCPWVHEHTGAIDHGTAYFEPNDHYASGGFKCQHSHGDQYRLGELLDFFKLQRSQARNKPLIRVIAGDLHRVVDVAEQELATRGHHFQSGGLIVSVSTDPTSGDPSIIPTTVSALTRELSIAADWERYDKRSEKWVPTDPPARHVTVLYHTQKFSHLPPGVHTRFGSNLPGIRCLAKTRRGTKCQSAAYKHNGRCRLHGGLSTGARTPEGLQRISEANFKHGRQTKDKLAAQRHAAKVGRRVLNELKRLERQLFDAGLMPGD